MTTPAPTPGSGFGSLGIKRIDHVAIVVASLETALAFYRDLLGITPSRVLDFPSESVKIAFLPLGGPEGSEIELLEPVGDSSGVARFLQKHGEGLHHLCLEVEDVGRALHDLQTSGVAVLDTTPRLTADGHGIFIHPRNTGGVLLELIERLPKSGSGTDNQTDDESDGAV